MSDLASIPFTMDPADLEKQDPMTLGSWFSAIAEAQDRHNTDPEVHPELTPDQCRFALTLTRILRRTNTGPARAKSTKPKAPTKKAATAAFLEGFLKS